MRRPCTRIRRHRWDFRHLLASFGRHRGAGVGVVLGTAAGLVDFEVDAPSEAADLFWAGSPPTWNTDFSCGTGGWKRSPARRSLTLRGPSCASAGPRSRSSPSARRLWGRPAAQAWNGVWEVAPLPES